VHTSLQRKVPELVGHLVIFDFDAARTAVPEFLDVGKGFFDETVSGRFA
jgi:hypothetical protein